MSERPISVTCYITPAHDLYHLSCLLTGLCELAGECRIELRFEPVLEDTRKPLEAIAMRAVAVWAGRATDIVFEVYDRSDDFEMPLLERCDIYFKRNFYEPEIRKLDRKCQQKVVPFGFNYACRSMAGEKRLLAADLVSRDSLDRYLLERPFESFEQSPTIAVSPCIVFQTRAWAPESTSDNADEVNDSRARIIRELRKAFRGRFHGGFVHSDFASERYPELLAEHSSEESAYVELVKGNLIGISTHGLHYSVPFKVPEYLAGSIAVVSEPLRNGFPVPFVEGQHFLAFREPEECVAQCDRILSNAHLASELRQASWQYYRSEIRPAQHVASLLERAFLAPPSSRTIRIKSAIQRNDGSRET
jgi:hypothetical protein